MVDWKAKFESLNRSHTALTKRHSKACAERDVAGRLSEGLEADVTDLACEVNDLKAENRRLLDRLEHAQGIMVRIMACSSSRHTDELIQELYAVLFGIHPDEEPVVEGNTPPADQWTPEQIAAMTTDYRTEFARLPESMKQKLRGGETADEGQVADLCPTDGCLLKPGHAGKCFLPNRTIMRHKEGCMEWRLTPDLRCAGCGAEIEPQTAEAGQEP